MDVILASTDALRTMIDNLESTGTEGQVDTAHIIVRIEAILAGGVLPPADHEDGPSAPAHADTAEVLAPDAPTNEVAPMPGKGLPA